MFTPRLQRSRSANGSIGDPPDRFAAWVDSHMVRVSLTRQHGQWYAVADDFGIAGVGRTKAAALRDAVGLVDTYLRSYFLGGRPYQEALRPSALPFWLMLLTRIRRRRSELVLPSVARPSQ